MNTNQISEKALTKVQTQPADRPSVEGSLANVKRLIDWLEYVREDEFLPTESKRLIGACESFARIAQPITSKYID